MSNSIWKKPEEEPKDFCDVVLANSRTGSCCVFLTPFHNVSFDYDKWCYLTDLIAQADKAEQLQKAVDLAVDALKRIKEPTAWGSLYQEQEIATEVLEQITALEQKSNN